MRTCCTRTKIRRLSRFRIAITASLTFLAFACNGCTVIHLDKADGESLVQRHFGVLSIKMNPARSPQVIETTGLGVISMQDEVTVGYQSATKVLLGRDCHTVFVIKNQEQFAAAQELARTVSPVCKIRVN